jgi:hypothetical protein
MTGKQADELRRQVIARLRSGKTTPAAELRKVGARPARKPASKPARRKR